MAEATTPAAKRGSGRKAMGEITSRRVLAIALPIVLSNATIPLLGMVDTGVVGQLGRAEPIGAVAIGAVILTSLYWVFSFLRMGTSGLVAQAHGAADHLLRQGEALAGVLRGLGQAEHGGGGQAQEFAGLGGQRAADDEVDTAAGAHFVDQHIGFVIF